MAIDIKVYSKQTVESFTSDLATDSVMETGSANALCGAMGASLLYRAAALTDASERQEYILRNAEILRTYFLHLMDDDRKCRVGYNKECKAGDPVRMEAAIHPAVSVNEEILSMCDQMLNLGLELKAMIQPEYCHYLQEMAEIAVAASKSAVHWILNLTSQCSDETYRYVVKRENELNLEEIAKLYEQYKS